MESIRIFLIALMIPLGAHAYTNVVTNTVIENVVYTFIYGWSQGGTSMYVVTNDFTEDSQFAGYSTDEISVKGWIRNDLTAPLDPFSDIVYVAPYIPSNTWTVSMDFLKTQMVVTNMIPDPPAGPPPAIPMFIPPDN